MWYGRHNVAFCCMGGVRHQCGVLLYAWCQTTIHAVVNVSKFGSDHPKSHIALFVSEELQFPSKDYYSSSIIVFANYSFNFLFVTVRAVFNVFAFLILLSTSLLEAICRQHYSFN